MEMIQKTALEVIEYVKGYKLHASTLEPRALTYNPVPVLKFVSLLKTLSARISSIFLLFTRLATKQVSIECEWTTKGRKRQTDNT